MPEPFQPIGTHPYAQSRSGYDAGGRLWIECLCSVCGPPGNWTHRCHHPQKLQRWLWLYAVQHAHGATPRRA